MVDNVDACLGGAHQGRPILPPVGKSLTIVIAFWFANAQGCVGNIVVGNEVYVMVARAGGGHEAEVLSYDR